jgi:glycosyltransferase involved in cell wall biosynthesis
MMVSSGAIWAGDRVSVLAATRYGPLGASSRMRTYQYAEALAEFGIDLRVSELIDDRALAFFYQHGWRPVGPCIRSYAKRIALVWREQSASILWVEKELLPWLPYGVEHTLLVHAHKPLVLDYDDAIFHNYDRNRFWLVQRALGKKIDALMEMATTVTVGNSYLAGRALAAGAHNVEIIPTVVDLRRYPASAKVKHEGLRIVWIGSPATSKYLELVAGPLATVALRYRYQLTVIGGRPVSLPGVPVEWRPWAAETEAADISESDIGIMPLPDEPWEWGKCGYKLIQYMACGLPVVASPVGVNRDIVSNGTNGFLAGTDQEWTSALSELLESAQMRSSMGTAGRVLVERSYCLQVTAPRLAAILRSAAGGNAVG